MASLAEFARVHTRLGPQEIDHLQRLVASWGLLADLCFADLLLFTAADASPDADDAGRDVENWLKCWYMQDRVNDAFEGR